MTFLGGRIKISILFIPVVFVMSKLVGFEQVAAFAAALVIHEAAHAAVAAASGLRIDSMELMPFGCTANISGMGETGIAAEAVTAAAGPAANLIVAAAVHMLNGWESLVIANLSLAGVNMIPGLPLDGGRMLSALMMLFMPRLQAEKAGAVMGLIASAGLCGVGAYAAYEGHFNPTLFLMGGFMAYSAAKCMRYAPMRFINSAERKDERLRQRPCVGVKTVAAHRSRRVGEVLSKLDAMRYNVVHVVGDNMEVIASVDEEGMRKAVLRKGAGANMEDAAGISRKN